jgi:hypothetical protein
VVRLGIVLACLALALGACGGEEVPPLSLKERLVQPGDAPNGYEPDGQPTSTRDVNAFVSSIKDTFVQMTPEEATRALADAGFVAAANGGLHNVERDSDMGSAAVQFESEEGATDALELRHEDALKPCRERCDIVITEFDVPDIPDATGVQRSKTEESSAGAGEGPLFDSFEVSFVDGPFLYVVRGIGPPGSVTKDQVIDAAKALHERVEGAPAPS